jgi:hypothetical protein
MIVARIYQPTSGVTGNGDSLHYTLHQAIP